MEETSLGTLRHDWTISEIEAIYHTPLLELIYQAAGVHRQYHKANEVQVCTLLSIKTGGCPEDCAYCPQAARYHTNIKVQRLMDVEQVVAAAQAAKEAGSTRFCMGAAWREVRDNRDFDKVLEMIRQVSNMGLEVCCTLGMITEEQARKMKEAGLYAYNHNLDTSEDYYGEIITTRQYADRLQTLENVRKVGLTVCCGGIIGMGEKEKDRLELLQTLATMKPHPESVPINALVAVEGTPLQDQKPVSVWEMVRMIATARILMPRSFVRLSAGRINFSIVEQALCFLAGANSIFAGEKLLTTPNNLPQTDLEMFELLGLTPRLAYQTELSLTSSS
ncbi:MAG: biotin synthase BioB [Bacteroidia bacterium]|nr:biotin synthase BioB [Bacteroidia bacterium]MDW8157500.1 biotin synthase BioB [Bacteroidia bacterium]